MYLLLITVHLSCRWQVFHLYLQNMETSWTSNNPLAVVCISPWAHTTTIDCIKHIETCLPWNWCSLQQQASNNSHLCETIAGVSFEKMYLTVTLAAGCAVKILIYFYKTATAETFREVVIATVFKRTYCVILSLSWVEKQREISPVSFAARSCERTSLCHTKCCYWHR